MRNTLLTGCTALVALTCAGMAGADSDQAGTTAASFLTVGSGADILGRAGATLGLRGDISTVPWNPGALGFLRETEIALSHATLLDDHSQEHVAAGGRMRGTDLRWSLSGLYESEGSLDGRDALDNPTGGFAVSSFAAGGHVAYPIAGMVSVGAGAKWVNENLGLSRGAGLTFDGGLQMHAGILGVGIAAQNVFGKMRFGNSSYDFPTNYAVGIALDHVESGLRFAVDANFPGAYYSDVRTGIEWRWRDLVAVRGGYRSEIGAPPDETLSGPSFGFGAGVYGMWLDYGYVVPGNGSGQHRLGLTLRPGHMNFGGGAVGDLEPAAEPKPRQASTASAGSPAAAAAPAPAAVAPAPTTPATPGGVAPAAGTSAPPAPAGMAPSPAAAPVAPAGSAPATAAAPATAETGAAPASASAPVSAAPPARAATGAPAAPNGRPGATVIAKPSAEHATPRRTRIPVRAHSASRPAADAASAARSAGVPSLAGSAPARRPGGAAARHARSRRHGHIAARRAPSAVAHRVSLPLKPRPAQAKPAAPEAPPAGQAAEPTPAQTAPAQPAPAQAQPAPAPQAPSMAAEPEAQAPPRAEAAHRKKHKEQRPKTQDAKDREKREPEDPFDAAIERAKKLKPGDTQLDK